MKEELTKRFLDVLREYHSLGIAEQIDYQKFYLDSLITNSIALTDSSVDPIKPASDPINLFDDPIKQKLYQAVLQDGTLNYADYATQIGVSEATVKRRLGELKNDGVIIRVGSNKTGHWEVLNHK